MAKGVQLATAYISLNVDTRDVKKQVEKGFSSVSRMGTSTGRSIGSKMASGMRDALGGGRVATMIFSPLEIAGVRWAAKAGAAVGAKLKTAIVAGVSAGIGAAILGAGATLAAGLARLQTLQQSRIQLSLKLSDQEISKIQQQIAEVVTGTNVTLEAAMSAVPKAINSKMSVEATKQYVKDVADAAAATGGKADFTWIDEILTQVRNNGALLTDEIQQLTSAGLDIRGTLKDAFEWDDKTLDKNLKAKKIRIEDVQKAIQKVYGSADAGDGKTGLAQILGTKTLDGSVKALKSSLSRIGAGLIAAFVGKDPAEDPLEVYAEGINKITDGLKGIETWIANNREEIHGVFVGTKDAVNAVTSAVVDLVNWFKQAWGAAQNLGSKIASGFNTAKSSVTQMWTKTKEVFGQLKKGLSDVVEEVKKKFDAIFGDNGWFARQFQKLGETVDKVRDVLGLGPATANAAAPGGSPGGTTPFNPGPMAPGVAAGRQPLGGSSQGLQSVPGFGLDANGNPLVPSGKSGAGKTASAGTGGFGPIKSAGTPYGLPIGTDTGGYGNPKAKEVFPPWVFQLADRFGVLPSTYGAAAWNNWQGHQEGSGMNRGIDFVGTVEQMDAFARFLVQAKPPGLKQVIWQNPKTLFRVGSVDNRPVGPDLPDTTDPDYYRRGNDDWVGHQDHVHTTWTENLDLSEFASGGKVVGAGNGTSDSIPAMLSNGEHVLTAADVKKMGGQSGVYSFRQALQAGMIPGFAPGGAVDPNVVQDANDAVADLTKEYEISRERLREVMANEDSSDSDRLQAQIAMDQAWRAAQQAQADLPIISSGGTPPDRSQQNALQDAEDTLKLQQQALADLNAADDVPYSQRLQQNYAVAQATRERDQLLAAQGQSGGDYGNQFLRSLGFIPANAGNTGVAGTSSLANFIGMGNDIVGGVIDTGANLAQQAVSAGIMAGVAAGTFGGGAAAAPLADAAASYGIQLAANTAKRISAYGFQMAGIGADVLVEQLFPFGAPRWMGYDYTNFMPQLGIQEAALGTLEQMGSDEIKKAMAPQQQAQPGAPAIEPSGPAAGTAAPTAPQPLTPTDTILQPGDPGFYTPPMTFDPFNPNGAGGGGGGGSWAKGGAVGIYDQGGILNPGEFAFNASRVPEQVLTKQQWAAMKANASTQKRDAPLVENLYAQDMQSAIRELEKTKRRDMMQYSGRP